MSNDSFEEQRVRKPALVVDEMEEEKDIYSRSFMKHSFLEIDNIKSESSSVVSGRKHGT